VPLISRHCYQMLPPFFSSVVGEATHLIASHRISHLFNWWEKLHGVPLSVLEVDSGDKQLRTGTELNKTTAKTLLAENNLVFNSCGKSHIWIWSVVFSTEWTALTWLSSANPGCLINLKLEEICFFQHGQCFKFLFVFVCVFFFALTHEILILSYFSFVSC